MSVSPFIKHQTHRIAKSLAPIDTGNLRYNAIHLRKIKPNSWTIAYDSNDAYYIEYLEDGTLHSTKHRNFIRNTANVIAIYLYQELNGKPRSRWIEDRVRQTYGEDIPSERRSDRHFDSLYRAKVPRPIGSSVNWY